MLKAAFCVATVLVPASHAFKAVDRDYILDLANDPEMQRLSLIDEIGTAPCVFKLNNSFYDFTPIKLAQPSPRLGYYDGTYLNSLIS